jgi:RNA recognition motif-containing protein
MGRKLYVGKLNYDTTNEGLGQAFAAYGKVDSAEVIMDRMTGRSKGFGFVEMSSDAEAQAAIAGLNGQELDGRTIVVNEARPKEPRTGGRFGGGGGGGFGGGFGGGGGGGDRGGDRFGGGGRGGRSDGGNFRRR